MMRKIGNILRFALVESRLFRRVRNTWCYPSLGMDYSATVTGDGEFVYGRECNIERGARVLIKKSGRLHLGSGTYIGSCVELAAGAGQSQTIGDHVTIQDRCKVLGNVAIGSYTLIGPGSYFSSGTHNYAVSPHSLIIDQDNGSHKDRPIVIEEDCWIGVNVAVMPGVRIGRGCVVSANSVVTKDLPPYSVAFGAPIRVVSQRIKFEPPHEILSNVREHLPYFYSGFYQCEADRGNGANSALAARARFSVCLASTTPPKQVCLRARSLADGGCALWHNGISIPLNGEFATVSFPLASETGQVLEFEAKSDGSSGQMVAIERVWLES
jgi:acetyltransferase-like isoleucine patch superfamily enzyme